MKEGTKIALGILGIVIPLVIFFVGGIIGAPDNPTREEKNIIIPIAIGLFIVGEVLLIWFFKVEQVYKFDDFVGSNVAIGIVSVMLSFLILGWIKNISFLFRKGIAYFARVFMYGVQNVFREIWIGIKGMFYPTIHFLGWFVLVILCFVSVIFIKWLIYKTFVIGWKKK